MNVLCCDFDRRVAGTCGAVRQVLIDCLQSHGFKLDRVESNSIQAHLGNALAPRVGRDSKPALRLRVVLLDVGDAVEVDVRLADAAEYVFDREALQRRYSPLFQEIQEAIDQALRAVDATTQTPAPTVTLADQDVKDQLVRALRQHTRGTGMTLPDGGRRLQVLIDNDGATLEPSTVDSLVAVCRMALSDPTIPQPLVARGERIHDGLMDFIDQASGGDVLRLEPSDRRVFEFLYRQVQIRGMLPVRELYHCLDCDFKKVTNPDYRRELGKARLKQSVVSGFAGALTMGYMAILGTAARSLAANNFDFVCPQCQGSKAEVTLVTFCPNCKKLRVEPVLRSCSTPGCGYDFMASAKIDALWSEWPPGADPRTVSPAPAPAPPPARQAGTRQVNIPSTEPSAGAASKEAVMTQTRLVHSVFVSCEDTDTDAVQPLLEGLRRMHYDVLLPQAGEDGRLDFTTVLTQIERCDVFLIALSPALLASEAGASQRAFAARLGKTVVVVEVQDTATETEPPELASLPRVDFTQPGPVSAFDLADQLSRMEVTEASDRTGWPGEEQLAELRRRADAPSLSLVEQTQLVAALRSALGDDDTEESALRLMSELRARPDLYAAAAREIDDALSERTIVDTTFQGASPAAQTTPPGWYPDPTGRHQLRWFEGDWSDYASDNGFTVTDQL